MSDTQQTIIWVEPDWYNLNMSTCRLESILPKLENISDNEEIGNFLNNAHDLLDDYAQVDSTGLILSQCQTAREKRLRERAMRRATWYNDTAYKFAMCQLASKHHSTWPRGGD